MQRSLSMTTHAFTSVYKRIGVVVVLVGRSFVSLAKYRWFFLFFFLSSRSYFSAVFRLERGIFSWDLGEPGVVPLAYLDNALDGCDNEPTVDS